MNLVVEFADGKDVTKGWTKKRKEKKKTNVKKERKERCNLQWSISVELLEIQMKLLPSVGNDVRKFVKKKL